MSETIIHTALRHQEHRAQGSALRSYGGSGGDGGVIIARFPGAGKHSPKQAAAIAAEAAVLDEANIAARMSLLNETREAAILALGWKAEARVEDGRWEMGDGGASRGDGRSKMEDGGVRRPKKPRVWPMANLRPAELIPCPPEMLPLRERACGLMQRVGFVHNARRALGMDGTRWKAFTAGTLEAKHGTWGRLARDLPAVLDEAESKVDDPLQVVTSGSAARLLPSASEDELARLRAVIAGKVERFGYMATLKRKARVAKEVIFAVLGTSHTHLRVNCNQWQRLWLAATSGEVERALDEVAARRKIWTSKNRKLRHAVKAKVNAKGKRKEVVA